MKRLLVLALACLMLTPVMALGEDKIDDFLGALTPEELVTTIRRANALAEERWYDANDGETLFSAGIVARMMKYSAEDTTGNASFIDRTTSEENGKPVITERWMISNTEMLTITRLTSGERGTAGLVRMTREKTVPHIDTGSERLNERMLAYLCKDVTGMIFAAWAESAELRVEDVADAERSLLKNITDFGPDRKMTSYTSEALNASFTAEQTIQDGTKTEIKTIYFNVISK